MQAILGSAQELDMPKKSKKHTESFLRAVILTGAPMIAVAMIIAAVISSSGDPVPLPPGPGPIEDPELKNHWPEAMAGFDHQKLAQDLIGFHGQLTPRVPPTESLMTSLLDCVFEVAASGDSGVRDIYEDVVKRDKWKGLTKEVRSWSPSDQSLTVDESLGAAVYLAGRSTGFDDIKPFLDYAQGLSQHSPESVITEAVVLIRSGLPNRALQLLDNESVKLYQASVPAAFAAQFYKASALGHTGDNLGAEVEYRAALELVKGSPLHQYEQAVARLALADSLLANVLDAPHNFETVNQILDDHESASNWLPSPHPLVARGNIVWARYYSTGHAYPHYDLDEARAKLVQATTQYRELDNRLGMAMCERYQGRIALGEGDWLDAALHYRKEAELQAPLVVLQAGALVNVCIALSNEALRVFKTDPVQAVSHMHDALEEAEKAVGLLIRVDSNKSTLKTARDYAAGCRAWLEENGPSEIGLLP